MDFTAFDRGLGQLLKLGRHLPSLSLEGRLLAEARHAEVLRLSSVFSPKIQEISLQVEQRIPEAVERYDQLVNEALQELRALQPSGLSGILSFLDRKSLLPRPEFCDDPACPEDQRRAILASIDWLNEHLQSYQLWIRWMQKDLRTVDGHPTRVLDLAAGHAGFAIVLKEYLGNTIEVTASDLFQEYLELGREQAHRRGVQVEFRQQDATDLRALREEQWDVIICTQSIHHFPPGMVARMFGEATRIARRSVWFIDAERSLLAASLLGVAMGLHCRAWPPIHDTIVSLRKMYTEEELSLLGNLAPGIPAHAQVSTGQQAPGYTFLRASLTS